MLEPYASNEFYADLLVYRLEKLAKATGTPSKSLMRMLGPKGNPRASNLLTVLGKLQRVSGVHLAVAAGK